MLFVFVVCPEYLTFISRMKDISKPFGFPLLLCSLLFQSSWRITTSRLSYVEKTVHSKQSDGRCWLEITTSRAREPCGTGDATGPSSDGVPLGLERDGTGNHWCMIVIAEQRATHTIVLVFRVDVCQELYRVHLMQPDLMAWLC